MCCAYVLRLPVDTDTPELVLTSTLVALEHHTMQPTGGMHAALIGSGNPLLGRTLVGQVGAHLRCPRYVFSLDAEMRALASCSCSDWLMGCVVCLQESEMSPWPWILLRAAHSSTGNRRLFHRIRPVRRDKECLHRSGSLIILRFPCPVFTADHTLSWLSEYPRSVQTTSLFPFPCQFSPRHTWPDPNLSTLALIPSQT